MSLAFFRPGLLSVLVCFGEGASEVISSLALSTLLRFARRLCLVVLTRMVVGVIVGVVFGVVGVVQ